MGDYSPLYEEGDTITLQASATITGGQLCMISGSGTVAKTSGAVTNWCGVAAFDAVNGDKVTLFCGGVQKLVASGGITAGDQVVAAANGAVSTLAAAGVLADEAAASTAINSARQVVGIALTTATDGNTVQIQMVR